MTVYFTSHFKQPRHDLLRGYFQKNGFKIAILHDDGYVNINPEDILVSWNCFNRFNHHCVEFQNHGCKVLILENPYIKMPQYISVGMTYHNNIKYSLDCMDNGERFKSFGVTIKPWSKNGSHILVASQAKTFNMSGNGHALYKQPYMWDEMILKHIRKYSNAPVYFKPHPNGTEPDKKKIGSIIDNITVLDLDTKMEDVLPQCFVTVVHTSNAATDSILNGVPVVYTGHSIFLKDCCNYGIENIKKLTYPDNREKLLHRMAWNQFSMEEIENGFMMKCLDIYPN